MQAADFREEDDICDETEREKPQAALESEENAGAEDHTDDQVDQTSQKKFHGGRE
jgi:hypothetical protein